MDTNHFTPEDSLRIIDKATSTFKTNYKESAQIFLLWGWILTLACFGQFILLKILIGNGAHEQIGLFSLVNWGVFVIVGFIFQLFVVRKINREKKVQSYLEGYLKSLWMVIVASFAVATVLCIRLEIEPLPFIFLIVGIGTTTTGLLIKFSPLAIGGITFFIFSIATSFVSSEYLNLLAGAAIICGLLVPGHLLKSAKE